MQEDILDQIEFIRIKLVKDDIPRRQYEEFNPSMPASGSRVRRGPQWHHGNKDSQCVGTVIGHNKRGN